MARRKATGMRRSRRQNNDNRSVSFDSAEAVAERLGTSLMAISRWRRRLSDIDAAYAQAVIRYARILEFDAGGTRGVGLSLAEEWYTPERYLEAARKVLGGIDLDPASSAEANRRVKASQFFTVADDGLTKEWPGRVWLNPPYVGAAGPFSERLVEQYRSGITTAAVLLVNAHSTDAAWFQPLWDFTLCFTDHRINFISGNGQAESGSNHGSVFVYLGDQRTAFIEAFSKFGAAVERAKP